MSITKTRTIVNAFIAMTNRGRHVFNDKLIDGRRSVKVWGWEHPDYERVRDMLIDAGCTVKLVYLCRPNRVTVRMHVTE